MRGITSWIVLALCLGVMVGGCRKGEAEAELSADRTAETPKASVPEADVRIYVGRLLYEDLEGGTWRFETQMQSSASADESGVKNNGRNTVFVLRAAPGCPPLETMIKDAGISAGSSVEIKGKPAAEEDNFGINMAGPYFEVLSIQPARQKE